MPYHPVSKFADGDELRPRGEVRDIAIAAYISSRRPALQATLKLSHREKDAEIRRLCREDFKKLTPQQQWSWADIQPSITTNGELGRFQTVTLPVQQPNPFVVGSRVQLVDLQGAAEMNGLRGVCDSYDDAAGRWSVLLDQNDRRVNVLPKNLQSVFFGPFDEGRPPLLWTELKCQQGRRRQLRAALDVAAGGFAAEPEQVAEALHASLSDDEKRACYEKWRNDTDVMFLAVGRKLVEVVLEQSKSFIIPVLMLCCVLRSCGWTTWASIHSKMNIWIPKRAWKHSAGGLPAPRVKHDNGRLGLRKFSLDPLQAELKGSSNPTCRPYRGKRGGNNCKDKAAKAARSENRPVIQMQSMNESVRQFYHKHPEISKVLKPSTMYLYMKRDFPEYTVCKRKLDCCGKCRQWDWQLLPLIRRSLRQWASELDEIWSTFRKQYKVGEWSSYIAHQKKNMFATAVAKLT